MSIVYIENIKVAYSADKHNFSVYDGNKRIVYNTLKFRTLKYIEQCNAIYKLKGEEHKTALKLFLKDNFDIEVR